MSLFGHGKLVTIAQYFTDRIDDYWHILYPVGTREMRHKDRYLYFMDISRKALDFRGPFDENGIYLFLGYDGNYHPHALEIAQYSLACWLAWRKTGKETWVEKALHHCNWLVKNQEKDGAWRVEHVNPLNYDLIAPWPSCLTNGLAISSLLRAYYFTKDKRYLSAAEKACDFFDIDVCNGGVKRTFNRHFIYEESPRLQLDGILNGHLSAIFGIYELSRIHKKYESLFEVNIVNLKAILPQFDMGYWSYYSLSGEIDSGFYHRLITTQLRSLREFDDYFLLYSEKMQKYTDNKLFAAAALLNKISKRLSKLKARKAFYETR